MGRPNRYSPEVRERSVRLVLDQADKHSSQWAAIESVASKIGCTPETLRGRMMSIYVVCSRAGLVLGQMLPLAVPASGFELFLAASAFYSLALIPVAFNRAPSPAPPRSSRGSRSRRSGDAEGGPGLAPPQHELRPPGSSGRHSVTSSSVPITPSGPIVPT